MQDFRSRKFSKGNKSVNDVVEVTILLRCTSSDDVLYLYEVA